MTTTKTPAELKAMTTAELRDLADQLQCPDGMRTPYNSFPLPTSRKSLINVIEGFQQRAADSRAIDRAVRGY